MMAQRRKWLLIVVVALVGSLAFAVLSDHGRRSALSYLGGVGLVVAGFEFGVFNIRLADRYAPGLTMAVALVSYSTTAVALGVALMASSPRVVDGAGVAAGLIVGLVVWLGALMSRSRVRV